MVHYWDKNSLNRFDSMTFSADLLIRMAIGITKPGYINTSHVDPF